MNRSKNTNIDRQVKDYYQEQVLDDDKMNHLLSLSTVTASTPPVMYNRRNFLMAASVGGVFVATGSVYSLNRWQQHRQRSRLGGNMQLITELVINHQNQAALDITSPSIATIANHLGNVDFKLELPDRLLAQADIIGGRYCSLLGESAIQVRLKDAKSNKDITAFVTEATENLTDFDGVTSNTEELSITANRYQRLFIAVVEQR